jgi:hypothetical protein
MQVFPLFLFFLLLVSRLIMRARSVTLDSKAWQMVG